MQLAGSTERRRRRVAATSRSPAPQPTSCSGGRVPAAAPVPLPPPKGHDIAEASRLSGLENHRCSLGLGSAAKLSYGAREPSAIEIRVSRWLGRQHTRPPAVRCVGPGAAAIWPPSRQLAACASSQGPIPTFNTTCRNSAGETIQTLRHPTRATVLCDSRMHRAATAVLIRGQRRHRRYA